MKYSLLLSICFLASACSSSTPSTNPETNDNPAPNSIIEPAIVPQSDLVNRTWALTHYQFDDGVKMEVSNEKVTQFTIRLELGNQPNGSNLNSVSGTVVCNGYSGNYVLEDNVLTLSKLFATEAACETAQEAPAPLFERFIFNQRSTMVALENDQLILTTSTNEKLYFSTDLAVDQLVEFSQIHSGDLAFTEDLTFNEPRFQVLRSNQQLHDLYVGALTPPCPECELEPLPMVDFSVAMVVLVAHEIVGSGGYDIAVTSVMPTNNGVQVNVFNTSPGENCGVDSAFTGPYRLYQINGVFDDVNFVERTVQSLAC